MLKKKLVFFSLVLLFCSNVVKAYDIERFVESAQNSSATTPPKGIEEKLAELLTTPEQRAAVVRIALEANMADVADAAAAQLAKAASFGDNEVALVNTAITPYGNLNDRVLALDKMILALEKTANGVHNDITALTGQPRIDLENKLADLTNVRMSLVSAKNDIANSSHTIIKNADVTLLGYLNVADTTTRRAVEGAAVVGVLAAVSGVAWLGKQVIGKVLAS